MTSTGKGDGRVEDSKRKVLVTGIGLAGAVAMTAAFGDMVNLGPQLGATIQVPIPQGNYPATPPRRQVKLYQNADADGKLQPIRRRQQPRPEGMTGRQWKKLRKGNKGL